MSRIVCEECKGRKKIYWNPDNTERERFYYTENMMKQAPKNGYKLVTCPGCEGTGYFPPWEGQ